MAPHVPAVGAPVATDAHDQRGWPPPEWFVGQGPGDAVTNGAFAAAAPAPLIGFTDPAGQDRAIGLEALTGDDEAELVKPAEGGQVGVGERIRAVADGSVRHVEVFRDERVGAFILGRPRRLSRYRRASPAYTLNCEEPRSCKEVSSSRQSARPRNALTCRDPRAPGQAWAVDAHGDRAGLQVVRRVPGLESRPARTGNACSARRILGCRPFRRSTGHRRPARMLRTSVRTRLGRRHPPESPAQHNRPDVVISTVTPHAPPAWCASVRKSRTLGKVFSSRSCREVSAGHEGERARRSTGQAPEGLGPSVGRR